MIPTDLKTVLLKKCDPCPTGIKCVPHIQCPAHLKMDKKMRPQVCELNGGKHGLCCTSGQNHTGKAFEKNSPPIQLYENHNSKLQ